MQSNIASYVTKNIFFRLIYVTVVIATHDQTS